MIAKFFQHKFGVHAKFSDLRKFNQQQLETLLLKKGLKKKKIRAAIKIQKYFRGYKGRIFHKELLKKRNAAVVTIQNTWKRYRMLTMIPKVMKERKKRAYVIIQKVRLLYITYLIL